VNLKARFAIIFCSSTFCLGLEANIEEYYPYKVAPNASNYGNTGILEIPNARFMKEASLRFNFSSSFPNEHTSLTASPFNWLEATYRYAEIKNRKYGPAAYSGNQSFKDKGFDLKFRLLKETERMPSIAIGMRDIAGTGLFSSEYIIATKDFNNIDFSLGLGWGVLGSESNIRNPFSSLNERFSIRQKDPIGEGGEFSLNSWFSGETAILGGIEYDLKKYGLKFKLEYDTSNPDKNNFVKKVKSRFNMGLSYYLSESLNLSAALERGDVFRISFNLTGNFLEDTITKPGPKNVVKLNEEQLSRAKVNKEIIYRSLNKSLRDENIYIQAADIKEDQVSLAVASKRFYSFTRMAGRSARVTSALTPDEVERINIHSMNGDFEMAVISIDRKKYDKADKDKISSNELLINAELFSNSNKPLYTNAEYKPDLSFPEFEWNMSPSLKHQIGGPEGFYLGQLLWKTDTTIKFKRNLSLYTSFGINIYDTFNDLNNPSQSSIPKVRSDIQKYLDQGKNNLQRMQLEYFGSPYKDVFFRMDLGILEEMFAGFGGEVLYRPFNRKAAIGLSIHRVRQRDFNQRLGLRDYKTTTGHLGIYFDLPRKIHSQILIGKYLAKDKGVTLDLSRRFKTGFTLGVFASKTNLSAEEFGEGSFDKGFYISVPTKLFYSDYRSGNISFGLHPLTKDGASLLNQHNSLFSILGDSNISSVQRDWGYFLN